MKRPRAQQIALIATFLLMISVVGVAQAILDVRDGETPLVADLFKHAPTAKNLRSFEKDLETSSWFAKQLRPWMEFLRFITLRDPGQKALLGRDGWWFYKPDVRCLIEPLEPVGSPGTGCREVISAIVSFRDQLARRGIRLIVVPAPGKPSVYPKMLTARAAGRDPAQSAPTREIISRLRAAGVETIDLLEVFSSEGRIRARSSVRPQCYLARDTHWDGRGVRVAAKAIADRIRQLGWVGQGTVKYDLKPVTVKRRGDVLRMLNNPHIDRLYAPEDAACTQVVRSDTGKTYKDDPASPILVLGDSFLRIYERDEPGSAGLIAHLAKELRRPLASIVSDGGASTIVRQDLARRPDLLAGKKLVIWEFVERDIRFGAEGWQDVRLP